MKLSILLIALLFTFSACSAQQVESQKVEVKQTKSKNQQKNLVLVELFTSEGCSSCPPADKVLARLQNEQPLSNIEIVPLALHVDYWNYLGWKDEFSSNQYSQRQSGYAESFKLDSSYTPQMVIDGKTQFVGSNFETAVNAVKEAAKMKKATVEMALKNDQLKIEIAELPEHDTAYVWLAIAEDNLQTNVRRGENSGKKLNHAAVVREMQLLGNVESGKNNFSSTANLVIPAHWKKENLSLIVFVQGQNSKQIFALGKKHLV